MQMGALTLKKDQPSSFNKHSGCLKVLVACENVGGGNQDTLRLSADFISMALPESLLVERYSNSGSQITFLEL